MKRALFGLIAGGVLGGLVGYLVASLISSLGLLKEEHIEFHLASWCAMHGTVLGANILLGNCIDESSEAKLPTK